MSFEKSQILPKPNEGFLRSFRADVLQASDSLLVHSYFVPDFNRF